VAARIQSYCFSVGALTNSLTPLFNGNGAMWLIVQHPGVLHAVTMQISTSSASKRYQVEQGLTPSLEWLFLAISRFLGLTPSMEWLFLAISLFLRR